MTVWQWMLLGAAGGYLVGSIPFGYLIGRSRGIDIRKIGSGNIGATNVLRTLGPRYAGIVFALDVLKGAVPVIAVTLLDAGLWAQIATAIGALAGHTWPWLLGFRGGRAVATSLGVFLVLYPPAALGALVVFVGVVAVTRYVSLGSIAGSLSAVILLPALRAPLPVSIFGAVVALLIVYRHIPNIRRLLAGTESRLGERVAIPPSHTDVKRKAE